MHTIPSIKIVQTDKNSQLSPSFSLLKVPQISVKKNTKRVQNKLLKALSGTVALQMLRDREQAKMAEEEAKKKRKEEREKRKRENSEEKDRKR
ncbi:hypothetical protein DPMN_071342 [Dreissena polymorpha]|uniref:Uncharacterized protein n=1 Tax=Dreissena polymorpha TaxID=45954 RepID=A0A9D3Z6S3_DREPO|nr:hypothetical protein DPMN_071342 [Dreissena polymorpha]